MAENIAVDPGASKRQKYKELLPQIEALVSGEPDLIANLGNVTAALKQAFGFLWVGFYRLEGNTLILGPFQGPVACTRISIDSGVCGYCARTGKSIIVPDVEQFPGHIACSNLSKSEIVIPWLKNGKLIWLLDIDSDQKAGFDENDQQGLEVILRTIDFLLD